MVESTNIAYFGYGSLVNLATLRTPYLSAHRARLSGWRRRWLSRPKVANGYAPIDGLAFLSVEPDPDTTIDGMVIIDHRGSLPSLDEREALYERKLLQRIDLEFLDGNSIEPDTETYLYVAQHPAAELNARILRSYLDAVMQGYHDHFGEAGVQDFINTTHNPGCSVYEDRHEPLYPRSVVLEDSQRELFDRLVPAQ